jgi:heme/copper-type cytochrome/quinol oxidase subunit 2
MKVSLKGSCECGLKKDVNGTEKEYPKIEAPDPEPQHETDKFYFNFKWILAVVIIVVILVMSITLYCIYQKPKHGSKVYNKLKVFYNKRTENSQQATPDLLQFNETVVSENESL